MEMGITMHQSLWSLASAPAWGSPSRWRRYCNRRRAWNLAIYHLGQTRELLGSSACRLQVEVDVAPPSTSSPPNLATRAGGPAPMVAIMMKAIIVTVKAAMDPSLAPGRLEVSNSLPVLTLVWRTSFRMAAGNAPNLKARCVTSLSQPHLHLC